MELWKDPIVPRVLPESIPLPILLDGRFGSASGALMRAVPMLPGEHFVAWGPHKGTRISAYGCGSTACLECYPFAYSCKSCGRDYPVPFPNGEIETCDHCKSVYDPKTDTFLEYHDPRITEES